MTEQFVLTADDHLVPLRINVDDVQRLGGSDAYSTPLANRVAVHAGMMAQHGALAIDNLTATR